MNCKQKCDLYLSALRAQSWLRSGFFFVTYCKKLIIITKLMTNEVIVVFESIFPKYRNRLGFSFFFINLFCLCLKKFMDECAFHLYKIYIDVYTKTQK